MQLGPLRNVAGTAEVAGCLSAAGLVGILTVCLSIYGARAYEAVPEEAFRMKTLSGRELPRDPLLSADGCAPSSCLAGAVARCSLGGRCRAAWCPGLQLARRRMEGWVGHVWCIGVCVRV